MYDPTWFKEYSKFLKSAQWQQVRERVFALHGKRCYCCKRGYGKIQVHHLSYENYRNPSMNDVVPLCEACHKALKDVPQKIKYSGSRMVLKYHTQTCRLRRRH